MRAFSKKEKWGYAAFGIVAALMGMLLFFKNPSSSAIFPPCPTSFFTGYYCPGCGTLRALHALTHGDIAGAFSQNALMVCFIPVLPLMVLFPEKFTHPAVPLAVLLLIVAFTVLRNTQAGAMLAPF